MDDVTTYALLTSSFFFVAIASALLVKYRQASQGINASTDLGHDLWSSLEQRLKKQDERILDVMGRLEVVQARMMSAATTEAPSSSTPTPPVTLPSPLSEEKTSVVSEQSVPVQQGESQESQPSQATTQTPTSFELDETQLIAIRLLSESPKNTRELTDALRKSREHTARIMKELFKMGLASRNEASKPFTYKLTEEGRRRIPTDSP